jgi:hypothetical protein
MQSFESIQPEDFNLEGIIYSGETGIYSTAVTRVVAKHFYLHAQKQIKNLV